MPPAKWALSVPLSIRLVLIADAYFAHFGLYPVLSDEVGFFWRTIGRIDLRADTETNQTRPFYQAPAWPKGARVVGYRHNGTARFLCQCGAADSVTLGLARRHAGAFREDADPDAVGQQCFPLFNYLVNRGVASAAVYGNWAHGGQAPAEDWYPFQLALEHLGLWWENGELCVSFKDCCVFDQDDTGLVGYVFPALDDVVEAAHYSSRP